MSDLKQDGLGGIGINGYKQLADAGFIPINLVVNASTPANTPVFVADRNYVIKTASYREEVAGTGGAATLSVVVAANGTAVSAGTAIHSGTANLVGTAATEQSLVLTGASNPVGVVLPAGSVIGVTTTGTLSSVSGVVSILLSPA